MIIERAPVNSTCISSIGYSFAHEVLDVEFRGGDVYRYFAVPSAVFASLLAAPSIGSQFNRAIKNRFMFAKLIEEDR
jgi:hypothetical protein